MQSPITLGLIAVTALVSWLAFKDRRLVDRLILWPPAVSQRHQYWRLASYGLLHADLSHLLFNMITLWSFGSAVERVFSEMITPVGFVLFYLSAIVVAMCAVTASLRTATLVSSTHRLPKVLVRYQNAMITPFIACGAWL